MAEEVWDRGKLQAVYIPAGTRGNGSERFSRANCDVLRWKAPGKTTEATYVISPRASASGQWAETGGIDERRSQDFGFYDVDNLIIESHNADGSDTIFGVQFFGPV